MRDKVTIQAAISLCLVLAVFNVGCALRRSRSESAAEYRQALPRPAVRQLTVDQLEQAVHSQVNDYRRSRGLSPLIHDPALEEEARQHSRDMARRGKISHDRFQRRFRHLQPAGFRGLAENVAMNLGHADPAATAVAGWIRSRGHHKNMISSSRPYTGIGVSRGRDGGVYFTQLFGER